ncbi:MAG: hypothetical protein J7M25_08895 [Deltaproteobacteria bacterium]|nr:hypothetical protein [Deltaproteobacteria bacterium]
MALLIEPLLRNVDLTERQRDVCLRGIAQMAMADGVRDQRELAFLAKFVDEFFEGADPTNKAFDKPVTDEDLAMLDSDRVRDVFVAYLYLTAYMDEDFSEPEVALATRLGDQLVGNERREEILEAVRQFLYRRTVFAFAFKNNRLDEDFARAASARFGVPIETALKINASVFNAVMALKAPTDDATNQPTEGTN